MPYCGFLKNKKQELDDELQALKTLVEEFKKTSGKENEEKIKQKFEQQFLELRKSIENFKEEYKIAAKEMLKPFLERRGNKKEEIQVIMEDNLSITIEGHLRFINITTDFKCPNIISQIIGHLETWNRSDLPIEAFNAYNLRMISGNLQTGTAKTFNAPQLQTVGGFLEILKVETLNISNLSNISGDLYINPDIPEILEKARELKQKGILKKEIRNESCHVII